MPTVFVTNKGGHDYTPAMKFGDIVYLSEGSINPYSVAKMYKQFSIHLLDSSPEDYILITGLAVMNSVASAIFARKHGRINWLQYHAQTGTYKSRTIMVDELIGDINCYMQFVKDGGG